MRLIGTSCNVEETDQKYLQRWVGGGGEVEEKHSLFSARASRASMCVSCVCPLSLFRVDSKQMKPQCGRAGVSFFAVFPFSWGACGAAHTKTQRQAVAELLPLAPHPSTHPLYVHTHTHTHTHKAQAARPQARREDAPACSRSAEPDVAASQVRVQSPLFPLFHGLS